MTVAAASATVGQIFPPSVELTTAPAVVKEVFDDDHWIKDEFANRLSPEILCFGESLAQSFQKFPMLDRLANGGNEQAALTAGFIHGILDDLLVSMKLLVAGKMLASGNLMRQAIEGVAVAILCAAKTPIRVKQNDKEVEIDYWREIKAQNPVTYAHRAINQLERNQEALRVDQDAILKLKSAQQHYHLFSHPSLMAMASRVTLGEPGLIFLGGGFDEAKLSAHRIEIRERTGFCTIMPDVIDRLAKQFEAADALDKN